ncbi:hypothetical protein D5F01_LYC03411 [Larimichthys crocea]|uniref:Uncharacterized protein n=1 Tax=Larimichthys crocea TaxID=215358 RepID=A0A6G0J610_LARCR|nr:hypothetical protein D5F01_LYC03411 [Larimichthys crocea]
MAELSAGLNQGNEQDGGADSIQLSLGVEGTKTDRWCRSEYLQSSGNDLDSSDVADCHCVFHVKPEKMEADPAVEVERLDNDNVRLQSQPSPTYLGVKLDRTLSFKQHLDSVMVKTALIRHRAGTTWEATTKTLRISTEALVFSAAEYCAPVWSHSTHVQMLPSTLPYELSPDAYEPLQLSSPESLPPPPQGCHGDTTARPVPLCHTHPGTASHNTCRHLQGRLGEGEMEGPVAGSSIIQASSIHGGPNRCSRPGPPRTEWTTIT